MSLVELSNKVTFLAEPGKTLLDSASSKGVFLEYSCRTGRCGVCKAKVLQGETCIQQNERALQGGELEAGYILTCCRSAETDLKLDIEDIGELARCEIKTLPCRIDSISKLADDVVEVVLRVPSNSALKYLPGQYIDVIAFGVRRSYSIANALRADGKIELQIRQIEQGVLSRYWFGESKVNDLLRLEGPLGTFGLRNLNATNIVFLATGTGIAPVKAMLEKLAVAPEILIHKKIYVYWGGRTAADIYWRPDFDCLQLEFIPVLSRADAAWVGRRGYVQQKLLEDRLDLKQSVIYACGSDAMIDSARNALITEGLPCKNFYSDAFVSSN